MATLNIPNTPQYANLIAMIEDIMNPTAKVMREFQEKLNESELALLFSAASSANTMKSAKSITKAPRNQTKAADDESDVRLLCLPMR